MPLTILAEGIVDFKPSVGVNSSYDDNVFRFSSPEQARAAFGSSVTSDVVVRKKVGLDIDLHLSRQLISFTSNLAKSKYNRFDQLDNLGKSFGLDWDWQLGNQFFGSVGISEDEALSGFDNLRANLGNIRVIKRKFAIANWRLHPSWVMSVSGSQLDTDNTADNFKVLNRQSDEVQVGVQYANAQGTRLGLAYHKTKTRFTDRLDAFSLAFFGDENAKNELVFNGTWKPSDQLKLTTRLTHFDVSYNNFQFNPLPGLLSISQRRQDGFNKRVGLDYLASAKTSINLSVYNELFEIEDFQTTYIDVTGLILSSSWRATDKVQLTASYQMDERDFLGETSLGARNRLDENKTANLSLLYFPTLKSSIQLSYIDGKRASNEALQSFNFNTLSATFGYNF